MCYKYVTASTCCWRCRIMSHLNFCAQPWTWQFTNGLQGWGPFLCNVTFLEDLEEAVFASSQKGGEDNMSNCFPGTGDCKQHSCSFWKCQREGKKVPRELSSSESTIGGSRIVLHTVISFYWKHCSGSPGPTKFPNSKHYLKNRHIKLLSS